MTDLKKIYQAATVVKRAALDSLKPGTQVSDDCQAVAPAWATSLRCSFPPRFAGDLTTNASRASTVIRKFTRNRKIYPNEESA